MRIVIVLLIAMVCALAGGYIAGSIVSSPDESAPAPRATGETRDRSRELLEAQKAFSAGAEVARQRQRNVPIGAGIGLVAGLGLGVVVASKLRPQSKA